MNRYLEKIASKDNKVTAGDRVKSLAIASTVGGAFGGYKAMAEHDLSIKKLRNPPRPNPMLKEMVPDVYAKELADHYARYRAGNKIAPAFDKTFRGQAIRRGALKGALVLGGINTGLQALSLVGSKSKK